ncbi:hypothetical protein HEB94_001054 [Actinopolymorpha pittospori]|uniref:Uncharacterized protein n=1 Tax=Actinopolymorpha pittospori TaxID=648752 RepID=A0A927MNZ6_9ACTN|nr:hypothetical protein [Actinopolymorpha pittospori]
MREWPIDQVSEHRFDDCVPAVSDVSLCGRFGVVGEERVMTPDREQLLLAGLVAGAVTDRPGSC